MLVTGALGSLLPKLGKLLKDEYNLQKGVREKIMTLSRELESAQAVLRIVGEVPWDQLDELVKLWVRDVKEASYDMEDIIDNFFVHVDGPEPTDPNMLRRLRKKMGQLFKKSKSRRKISKMIQDIKEKLEEVAARHARYTVDNVAKPAASKTIDPRLLNLYKRVTDLVGIEGPRNELIKRLSIGGDAEVSEEKMKIVSIVGFGGLGKTTLAKVVYEQLKPHFKCRAFVSVGQNPDMNKVFRDILIDLDRKYVIWNMNLLDEMKLIDELKEFVQEKRSLIVIDDVWDMESWKLMKCALQESNCGSRVVITTRICEIATHADGVYRMQPLSEDDSEKLLHARIDDGERKHLDDQSAMACDKILKKCAGVPLAIITISSLLASKPRESWSVIYNSIGFGHRGTNDEVETTRRILSFSYYDLYSHIKPCLLYLSIFKEDYEIEKFGLIWRWIGEGFISEEQAAGVGSLFELGERYFNELINRSMIQPVERAGEGYVSHCRVHDMVLDLVRSLSSQENFVTVLDGSQTKKFPQSIIARRLALHHIGDTKNYGQLANMGMDKVRSLAVNYCNITSLPSRIPALRVLDIENISSGGDYEECASILGNLVSSLHLRYFRLAGLYLPSKKLGELKFLQTLDLSEYLPEEVGLLTQLVSLRISHAATNVAQPGLISKLTSLQYLCIQPYDGMTVQFVKELGMLRELRVLETLIHVRDEIMEKALLESLQNLHNIQIMRIKGSSLDKCGTRDAGLASCGQLRHLRLECLVFSGLPMWIKLSLTPNLSYLYLKVTAMKEEDMETLGRLPELRYVELDSCCTELVSIKIPTGGAAYFQKLSVLRVHGSSILFDPYGCESSSVAPATPSLETLEFTVYMRSLKDATLVCFDKLLTGFENLGRNSLENVTVKLICRGARRSEVDEAEDALVHAAAVHPKHPTLEIKHRHVPAYAGTRGRKAYTEARTWKLANILVSEDIQALRMPDSAASSSKVLRLLYTNNGIALLALSSNAVHKLWKWQHCDKNPHDMSTIAVAPVLWQPADGIVMTNDTTDDNPEEATACNAISKNDSYLISASGGEISLFNMMTFRNMFPFMEPPRAATFLAFHPEDNNIIAIGMEDSSILIYTVRIDNKNHIISRLMGHQKKITGLAFSLFMGVLVSSGADAQLCAWNIDCWEKTKSTYIRPPSNRSDTLVGDTMVQFDYDGAKLLAVHESQLAIYDENLECLCSWTPRDALPAPVSSAVYSSDSLLIYAGFYDGAIGIFEAESLSLQCRIASSAYIPASISSGGESVYPMVVAAHPFKPYQFAVGMSDGAVHVLEPLDTDAQVGSCDSSGQRTDGEISSGVGGSQESSV